MSALPCNLVVVCAVVNTPTVDVHTHMSRQQGISVHTGRDGIACKAYMYSLRSCEFLATRRGVYSLQVSPWSREHYNRAIRTSALRLAGCSFLQLCTGRVCAWVSQGSSLACSLRRSVMVETGRFIAGPFMTVLRQKSKYRPGGASCQVLVYTDARRPPSRV